MYGVEEIEKIHVMKDGIFMVRSTNNRDMILNGKY